LSARSLDALFRPNSVAVIGASTEPAVGAVIMSHLLGASSWSGHAVHPTLDAVAGVLAYRP
jgi:acetyltransferase